MLADGNMILLPDPDGARLIWQMAYTDLSPSDVGALQNHFHACAGSFHGFTFIDPTDNMLVSSSDLTATAWQASSLIRLSSGLADPQEGTAAFSAVNGSQLNEVISQTLSVTAGYQYCFSIYAISAQPAELVLLRSGPATFRSIVVSVGPPWTRVISSGRLNDPGTSFTVAMSLAPGQQIGFYGPQLEAQILPSRYRPTTETGGVYANAHWGMDQLDVSADAPNLFSTAFSIETAI